MAILKKQLEKLNLTQREADVYVELLELGETTVEQISRKSKIKRTSVYDVIEALKGKGLIGTTKRKKRTLYYAEDPRILENQLEEKKTVLEGILPQLLSMASCIDKKPDVKYFEGSEGIKNVYQDTLNYPGQEILMWGTTDVFKYFDEEYMWDYYLKKRIEKKIWMRAIGQNLGIVQKIQAEDKKYLRETRLYDSPELNLEVEINLYGKRKIGIMSFKENLGLIIESEKIYTTLKTIFELNWKMLGNNKK
jgi:sugar-specific transcriptional regulator TrmB